MDKIIVTVAGLGLIGIIYWFFFGKKPSDSGVLDVQGDVDVIVDGGYRPSVIRIKKEKTTTLRILRKDPNSCLEDIILPDFKISKYLPLNKEVQVEITPQESGEFPFHCGMNMYHGKIIVE